MKTKPISGFENYSIDEVGNIYNKRGKSICKWIDNVGYYQCTLYKNGKRTYLRVHRLVAKAFIPNPDNFPEVNHKDKNKINNNINNLEWCTNQENTQHGYDNGCYTFKQRCYPIKVYDKSNNYLNTYKSIRNLCESLKLNRKTVTNILNNKKINNYNYLFEYDMDLLK